MSLRGFVLLYVNTINIFRLIKLLSFSPNMNNYLINNIFTFMVYGFSALISRFLHFILQHTTCFLLTAKRWAVCEDIFWSNIFTLKLAVGVKRSSGCYNPQNHLHVACLLTLQHIDVTVHIEPFTCSLFTECTIWSIKSLRKHKNLATILVRFHT